MSNQNNQIAVAPYQQLAHNWNTARANDTDTTSLIDAGQAASFHAFSLKATDTLLLPLACSKVHAYLVCDSLNTTLKMVLISDVTDKAIANGTTQIASNAICTLDYSVSSLPPDNFGTYSNRISDWQTNKNDWIQDVIQAGTINNEDSIVQVFEVPVSDLQNVLGNDTSVYLALKNPALVETSVEVIFYKATGPVHFYDVSVPNPPFGAKSANFGLLM
jgi:hypothetical protein